MKKVRIRIVSKLNVQDTLKQIKKLFKEESIQFNIDKYTIKSSKIPLPLLSFDYRQYSRKNWIGVNPFIFISSILIKIEELDNNKIIANVIIDPTRAILAYIFILLLVCIVSMSLPLSWIGIIFFLVFSIFSGFFIFYVCIKKLIFVEISNAICALK